MILALKDEFCKLKFSLARRTAKSKPNLKKNKHKNTDKKNVFLIIVCIQLQTEQVNKLVDHNFHTIMKTHNHNHILLLNSKLLFYLYMQMYAFFLLQLYMHILGHNKHRLVSELNE